MRHLWFALILSVGAALGWLLDRAQEALVHARRLSRGLHGPCVTALDCRICRRRVACASCGGDLRDGSTVVAEIPATDAWREEDATWRHMRCVEADGWALGLADEGGAT